MSEQRNSSLLVLLVLVHTLPGVGICYGQSPGSSQKFERFSPALVVKKDRPPDRWLGHDKVKHFLASAFITGAGFLLMHDPLDWSENDAVYGSSALSFSVGLSKELYDWKSKKGQASFKDLFADLLGLGFAVFLIKIT
ncbi:MAG: hypothetical protein ACE5HO_12060 [bacterium]